MTRLLAALSSPVAFAVLRRAIAGFGEDTVWSDAGLRVDTPEAAIVAAGHGGVLRDANVLSFPPQRRAEVRMINIETFSFVDDHASPFAALSSARLTATRASLILCLLWPRLLAFWTAAAPAASAVSSVMALPVMAWLASFEIHGIGATWLMTMRADCTLSPDIFRSTEAVAYGQSKASFWRTS